jgi:hypothetical protein
MDASRRRVTAAGGGIVLTVLCLAACGSTPYPGSGSAAAASPAATPRQVSPKNGGGSPGQGPLVVSGPASLPGGRTGGQPVVLRDRTLVITRVTRHPGPNQGSVLIDLALVIRNTSGKAIRNMSTFFRLVGPEGDVFDYQYKNSDNFYRPIGARASRVGMIEFEIPAAAASSLSLLYRPEIAAESALIRLKMS